MSFTADTAELEERIGYTFRDRSLLIQALTHASKANEMPDGGRDYERLEFLGDAVLETVTSAYLYQRYPEMREGELTRLRASLVCEDALFTRAQTIHLKSYIRLGKGEEKTGGRDRASIISDVMEAVTGAIYLDGGMECADAFIRTFILADVEVARESVDYKTVLQEIVQGKGRTDLRYEVESETGPAHDKAFVCAVYLGDERLGTGEGSSKRKAQQMAAQRAIERIEKCSK